MRTVYVIPRPAYRAQVGKATRDLNGLLLATVVSKVTRASVDAATSATRRPSGEFASQFSSGSRAGGDHENCDSENGMEECISSSA